MPPVEEQLLLADAEQTGHQWVQGLRGEGEVTGRWNCNHSGNTGSLESLSIHPSPPCAVWVRLCNTPTPNGCCVEVGNLQVFLRRMDMGYSRVVYRVGLPWWLSGKESASQCRRGGFDPWVRKISWRRKWQALQYFCLGVPTDRGAWQAIVHRVAESDMT